MRSQQEKGEAEEEKGQEEGRRRRREQRQRQRQRQRPGRVRLSRYRPCPPGLGPPLLRKGLHEPRRTSHRLDVGGHHRRVLVRRGTHSLPERHPWHWGRRAGREDP